MKLYSFSKKTALLTLICFSLNCLSGASAANALSLGKAQDPGASGLSGPGDLKTTELPPEFGKIEEVFTGAGDEIVILVQDAHAIPDAQENIRRIIDYFLIHLGIRSVGLEGASSKLDAQIFKSFPDKNLMKAVLQEYADRGELPGGVAAALYSGGEETVFQGVEDPGLYEDGLALYLAALRKEPELSRKLQNAVRRLQSEKQRIYSRQLLEIDEALEGFERTHQDMGKVLKKLAMVRKPEKGSAVDLILEEIESDKGRWTKDDPKLEKKYAEISGRKFSEEFRRYAGEIKEALFSNEDERTLDRKSRELNLQGRLAKLELGREEWEEIKASAIAREPQAHEAITGSESASLLLFAHDDLKFHLAFYQNAEKRDKIIFDQLQKIIKNSKRALLVSGGFHTQALVARLREQKITYAVVMPEIRKIPEKSSYQDQMRGEVSWKKYFEIENRRINLYNAFTRAVRDKLVNSPEAISPGNGKKESENQGLATLDYGLVKRWRDQIIRDLADKNQISNAHDYTRFLDEVTEKRKDTVPGLFSADSRPWMAEARKFIEGIKQLQIRGELSEQNILKLLGPSAIPARFNISIAPGDTVFAGDGVERINSLFARSGMRQAFQQPAVAETLVSGRSEIRSKKIMDVPRIHRKSGREFSSREEIDQYIEEPWREAMSLFVEKKIQTFYSTANQLDLRTERRQSDGQYYALMAFVPDAFSEANLKIFQTVPEKITPWKYGTVKTEKRPTGWYLLIPVTTETEVVEFSQKAVEIASLFESETESQDSVRSEARSFIDPELQMQASLLRVVMDEASVILKQAAQFSMFESQRNQINKIRNELLRLRHGDYVTPVSTASRSESELERDLKKIRKLAEELQGIQGYKPGWFEWTMSWQESWKKPGRTKESIDRALEALGQAAVHINTMLEFNGPAVSMDGLIRRLSPVFYKLYRAYTNKKTGVVTVDLKREHPAYERPYPEHERRLLDFNQIQRMKEKYKLLLSEWEKWFGAEVLVQGFNRNPEAFVLAAYDFRADIQPVIGSVERAIARGEFNQAALGTLFIQNPNAWIQLMFLTFSAGERIKEIRSRSDYRPYFNLPESSGELQSWYELRGQGIHLEPATLIEKKLKEMNKEFPELMIQVQRLRPDGRLSEPEILKKSGSMPLLNDIIKTFLTPQLPWKIVVTYSGQGAPEAKKRFESEVGETNENGVLNNLSLIPMPGFRSEARGGETEDLRARINTGVAILSHGGPMDFLSVLTGVSGFFELAYLNEKKKPAGFESILKAIGRERAQEFRELSKKADQLTKVDLNSQPGELGRFREEFLLWSATTQWTIGEIIRLSRNRLEVEPENAQIAIEYSQRAHMLLEAIKDFLKDGVPENGGPLQLENWLNSQKWQSKGPLRPVSLTVNGEIPPVQVSEPLFHIAIERILSNAFRVVAFDQNLAVNDQKIDMELAYDSVANHVRLGISNPGKLPEELLKSILSVKYDRKNFSWGGVGLPFAAIAIQKMGGSIRVENSEKNGVPIVRFYIDFPVVPRSEMRASADQWIKKIVPLIRTLKTKSKLVEAEQKALMKDKARAAKELKQAIFGGYKFFLDFNVRGWPMPPDQAEDLLELTRVLVSGFSISAVHPAVLTRYPKTVQEEAVMTEGLVNSSRRFLKDNTDLLVQIAILEKLAKISNELENILAKLRNLLLRTRLVAEGRLKEKSPKALEARLLFMGMSSSLARTGRFLIEAYFEVMDLLPPLQKNDPASKALRESILRALSDMSHAFMSSAYIIGEIPRSTSAAVSDDARREAEEHLAAVEAHLQALPMRVGFSTLSNVALSDADTQKHAREILDTIESLRETIAQARSEVRQELQNSAVPVQMLELLLRPQEPRSEIRAEDASGMKKTGKSSADLIHEWNLASETGKKEMLFQNFDEIRRQAETPEALYDWLMMVLLGHDFVTRRAVVAKNNFFRDPLQMPVDYLLKHLELPDTGDKHAVRNKRLALLILFIDKSIDETLLPENLLKTIQAIPPHDAYILEMRNSLKRRLQEEGRRWEDSADEKTDALIKRINEDPEYVLGENREIPFGEALLTEMIRFRWKYEILNQDDPYRWFHSDLTGIFLQIVKVPEFQTVLDRFSKRIREEKSIRSEARAKKSGVSFYEVLGVIKNAGQMNLSLRPELIETEAQRNKMGGEFLYEVYKAVSAGKYPKEARTWEIALEKAGKKLWIAPAPVSAKQQSEAETKSESGVKKVSRKPASGRIARDQYWTRETVVEAILQAKAVGLGVTGGPIQSEKQLSAPENESDKTAVERHELAWELKRAYAMVKQGKVPELTDWGAALLAAEVPEGKNYQGIQYATEIIWSNGKVKEIIGEVVQTLKNKGKSESEIDGIVSVGDVNKPKRKQELQNALGEDLFNQMRKAQSAIKNRAKNGITFTHWASAVQEWRGDTAKEVTPKSEARSGETQAGAEQSGKIISEVTIAAELFAKSKIGGKRLDPEEKKLLSHSVYSGVTRGDIEKFAEDFVRKVDSLASLSGAKEFYDSSPLVSGMTMERYGKNTAAAMKDLLEVFLENAGFSPDQAVAVAVQVSKESSDFSHHKAAIESLLKFIESLIVTGKNPGFESVIRDSGVQVRPEQKLDRIALINQQVLPLLLGRGKMERVMKNIFSVRIESQGYKEDDLTHYDAKFAILLEYLIGISAALNLSSDEFVFLQSLSPDETFKGEKGELLKKQADQIRERVLGWLWKFDAGLGAEGFSLNGGQASIMMKQVRALISAYRSEARIAQAA